MSSRRLVTGFPPGLPPVVFFRTFLRGFLFCFGDVILHREDLRSSETWDVTCDPAETADVLDPLLG